VTKVLSRGSHGPQILPGEERRRSQRVFIRIPVTLQATLAGQKVTIQATTASVNDHGALLLCPRTLAAETKMEIQNDRTYEKQLCRVTRTPVESPEGFLLPVGFVAPAPGFWRITFPPTNWRPPED
jgi:hypothetical protein